jgi:hypothetical protein
MSLPPWRQAQLDRQAKEQAEKTAKEEAERQAAWMDNIVDASLIDVVFDVDVDLLLDDE